MSALVAGELLKLRTTRTALAFAAAAVLLLVAFLLLSTLAGDPTTIADKRSALNFGGLISAILLIFGIVGATGEYRHRTLAPALLVAPDRARLDVARMLAYGIAALAVGLLMLAVAFGLGLPLLAGTDGPDLAGADLWEVGAGGVAASVLCAMIGVGVGILVRNQVAAVVGALVWFFIGEPLVPLLSEDLAKFTISTTAGRLGGGGGIGNEELRFGVAGLVLLGWTAVAMTLGVLVDRRRDVT